MSEKYLEMEADSEDFLKEFRSCKIEFPELESLGYQLSLDKIDNGKKIFYRLAIQVPDGTTEYFMIENTEEHKITTELTILIKSYLVERRILLT